MSMRLSTFTREVMGGASLEGQRALADHHAVEPEADAQRVALGLDVDVARSHGDRTSHDVVEDLDRVDLFAKRDACGLSSR